MAVNTKTPPRAWDQVNGSPRNTKDRTTALMGITAVNTPAVLPETRVTPLNHRI